MNLKKGTLLQAGKYRIERVLGQGGFGITYLAVQISLNRNVTIKEFFMSDFCCRDERAHRVSAVSASCLETVDRFKKKFIKEAQKIASLNHPHIIRIHDVFEENGTAYYVMEYHNGGSLSDLLNRQVRMGEVEAVSYIRQIADALDYIHVRKMNHLDVKPANVLLDDKGNAVLIDFGISKCYDSEGRQTSATPVGVSPGYAPFEQYKQGGVSIFSPTTDIYSLGATLYKLVTGCNPPDSDEISEYGFPCIQGDVSPSTVECIRKSMQMLRKDRPQSVAEFLAILGVAPSSARSEHIVDAIVDESTDVPQFGEKIDVRIERSDVVSSEEKNMKSGGTVSIAKRWKYLFIVVAVAIIVFIVYSLLVSEHDNVAGLELPRLVVTDAEVVTDKVAGSAVPESLLSLVDSQKTEKETVPDRINKQNVPSKILELEDSASTAPLVSQNQLKVSDTKVIAVNLGLSSGICWGDRNIGAKSPEDFGEYFAWGETVPKSSYTWETYSLCDGSRSTQTKYCTNSAYGEVDDKAFLERANDVASTVLGSEWRMPTNSDFNELIQECKWRTVRKNGCICFKVTGPNGKSIYLPAAGFQNGKDDCSVGYDGFYWSSSLDEEKPYNAYYMNIGDGYQFVGCDHRELGLTVRAVTFM